VPGAPLSELPDTLDGKVTVAGYTPGAKPRGKHSPSPFPKQKLDSPRAERVVIGSQEELLSRFNSNPSSPTRNFTRAVRNGDVLTGADAGSPVRR
jgi:hypothetical protein